MNPNESFTALIQNSKNQWTPIIVEPEIFPDFAEMLQYPLDTAVTMPIEAGSLLTVATDGSDEVQTTNVVTSRTALSL